MKIKMRTIYSIIILLNSIYANGIFSNGLEKSINFSISYKFDDGNLYDYNENNEVYVERELKPKIYDAKLSMVFKGKYEIGYNYMFNSSFVNEIPTLFFMVYLFIIISFPDNQSIMNAKYIEIKEKLGIKENKYEF